MRTPPYMLGIDLGTSACTCARDYLLVTSTDPALNFLEDLQTPMIQPPTST